MKNAQMMYKLAQEAKAEEKRAEVINAITFKIGDIIQGRAKKGFTDIRISTDVMGFNHDFMLTLDNVHELMAHIRQFGYEVRLLLMADTNEMILHINWAPNPFEEMRRNFGNPLDLNPHY